MLDIQHLFHRSDLVFVTYKNCTEFMATTVAVRQVLKVGPQVLHGAQVYARAVTPGSVFRSNRITESAAQNAEARSDSP